MYNLSDLFISTMHLSISVMYIHDLEDLFVSIYLYVAIINIYMCNLLDLFVSIYMRDASQYVVYHSNSVCRVWRVRAIYMYDLSDIFVWSVYG